MMADFKPALGTTHACALPPSTRPTEEQLAGSDDVLVMTFTARPAVATATYQLWTNLPTDDPQSWSGESWHEVTFVDKAAEATFPPTEAQDWPLLALSGDESPPLVAPARVLQTVLRIPLKDVHSSCNFEYTYRCVHPDGGIEWLGDGGCNGKLEITASPPAPEGGVKGGWKALASKAFANGASSATSQAAREWTGGPGRLDIAVGPGAEWAGFGLSWVGGVPVAQLLPTSRGAILPVVVVHTVEVDPPIFQVTTSLVEPGAPHAISASDGGVTCEDDPTAEPSFFDFGELTKRDLVLRAPGASMVPLAASCERQITQGIVPLRTTGSVTALYHPSSLIVYAPQANFSFPAAVHAPAAFAGTAAVYSARTDDVALLEAGKGVLLDLPRQGGAVLESLKIAQLRTVVGARGEPTDVLFGPLKAASTILEPEDVVGREDVPVDLPISHSRSISDATDLGSTDVEDSVRGDEDEEDDLVRDATDGTDDTMVAPSVPTTALKAHAAAFAPQRAESFLERLVALVWRFWQWTGVLGLFGYGAQATSNADEIEEPDAQTERTPLLAPSSTNGAGASSGPSVATAPPVLPAANPMATRSFTRIHLPSLPARAILSVPASSPFPTRLRLAGRPLGSNQPTTPLVYKEARVEEIAKDKDGRQRRFWTVELGGLGEGVDGVEWEAQAWVADT